MIILFTLKNLLFHVFLKILSVLGFKHLARCIIIIWTMTINHLEEDLLFTIDSIFKKYDQNKSDKLEDN